MANTNGSTDITDSTDITTKKKFRLATKNPQTGELKLLTGSGRPSNALRKTLVQVSGKKLKALQNGETVYAKSYGPSTNA